MAKARILIVENERLVATDIAQCLQQLGYEVSGTAVSAVDALRQAVLKTPDLVLMDIKLKGGIDGVQAAGALQERMDIPVVYLTAFADVRTVERAKSTFPSGYVLKPFDDRSLRTAVELALHRHSSPHRPCRREQHLSAALAGLRDGVIVTDARGRVVLINPAAQRLTGRTERDSLGRPVSRVFTAIDYETGTLIGNPLGRVALDGSAVCTADRTVLRAKDGARRSIEAHLSPIVNAEGQGDGVTIVFREATVS
ncbi:MAG: response regulator [Acidobacteriales bacterium]|nr:response regulator [Terriglobales bacterium]